MKRILCIDDNTHGCFARKTLLEYQGYKVEVANDGAEGLRKFAECEFDLVVVDYIMPDMNGIEVIRQIRAMGRPAKVILHSGFTDRLALDQLATGADMVLQKSAREIVELLETIGRLLAEPARKRAGRASSRSRSSYGHASASS